MTRLFLRSAAILSAAALSVSAAGFADEDYDASSAAPPRLFEQEPNNTPDQARHFAGHAVLVGEVSGRDQDAWMWTVEDEDADHLWSIELAAATSGLVRLDIIELSYHDPEALASAVEGGLVGTLPSGDSGSDRLISGSQTHLSLQTARGRAIVGESELLLPPGDYLIGMSAAGAGGDYEVQLRRGRRAALTPASQIDRNADEAIIVPPGEERVVLIEDGTGTFALEAPADQEDGQLWQVSVIGGLGTRMTGTLSDADGARLGAPVTAGPLRQHWRNVALEPGARLELEAQGRDTQLGIVAVSLTPLGVAAPGEEREPNDTLEQANWTNLAEDGFAGALDGSRDDDYFAFALDDTHAEGSQTLVIENPAGEEILACLQDFDRQPICRRSTSERFEFGPLQLGPGDYAMRLRAPRARSSTVEYVVSLETGPAPGATFARQPNDHVDWAAPMEPRRPVRAQTDIRRSFWFELPVSGLPQLWRIQVNGDAVRGIHVREAEFGRVIASNSSGRPSPGGMRLDRLTLLPGRYLVEVESDADIMLRAIPMGQPEPGWEVEPNDDALTANVLTLGERMQGNFHSGDVDMFTFSTHGWSQVSVHVDPPADAAAQVRLLHQGRQIGESEFISGETITMSSLLPAGDYHVALRGRTPSELEYALTVDIGAPWSAPDGAFLADRAPLAQPLPHDGRVALHAETLVRRGASHWIALPVANEDREVSASVDGGTLTTFAMLDADLAVQSEGGGRDQASLNATVPAGEAWLIHAAGMGSAPVIIVDDPALSEPDDSWRVSLSGASTLAAWRPERQRVTAELEIANTGDEPAMPDIEIAASRADARLAYDLPEAPLEAGESVVVAVDVDMPAWLPAGEPIALWARAGAVSAELRLTADPEADPIGPHHARIDEDLAGLVNLAWDALGARFTEDANERRTRAFHLINNTVGGDTGIRWYEPLGEALPVIELAGGGGDIHTLMFDQTSSLSGEQRWRRVRVETSADGRDFQPLITAELDVGDGQQVFRLDAPVTATHLRVTPLSDWGQTQRAGERANRPSGTGVIMALGMPREDHKPNLLQPELGGHVVWADGAQRPGRSLLHGALQRAHGSPAYHQREEQRQVRARDVVVGFHQQRLARLEALEWRTGQAQAANGPQSVSVSVSETSPLGPWTRKGAIELSGGEGRLAFDEPVLARYIRLEFEAAERHFTVPEHVAAYEAEGLQSSRSILGHWGWYTHDGPEEPEPQPFEGEVDTASSASSPLPLGNGRRGRLEAVGDVRAYTVTVPDGENTLEIALNENVSDRAAVRLIGPEGEAEIVWEREADHRRGTAIGLTPGEYRIELEEPVRSIFIVWDGSGSLINHRPAVFRAFSEFADGLIPEQEVANIVPIGFPPLIDGWAEHGVQLSQALAGVDIESRRFMLDAATSDGETGLLVAARRLDGREGERAIILIADAELFTPHRTELWPMLERVRPRIFSLGLNPGDAASDTAKLLHERDLIMNWAMAAGGRYSYSASTAALLRNLEAAMHEIRQPTEFLISAETGWTDPPEPGSLSVVSGDEPVVAGSVVHMIFDASGSMLRRMTGGRRIDVARTIAHEVIAERIPSNVPVALRAFGHTEPGSCETELLVAPSAGNHADVLAAVQRIEAINLARTPLAASLAAVPDDLEAFAGQRQLVVMLTDGEETCDGNVEAELERLMDSGVEIRLNIVGFHIDQAGLRDEFERLAEMGGGVYFDTRDGDGLSQALARSVAAEFTVRDTSGALVARGRVDEDPVELEAGRYTLQVDGQEDREIVIEPDSETVITL